MKPVTAFFFLLLFSAACDIFNSRDPEKPEQPRTTLQQAFEKEQLIDNLITSMRERLLDYTTLFSDTLLGSRDFSFIPSSQAVSLYPSLAGEWDLRDEEFYFKNLISRDIPANLQLLNSEFTQQSDSVVYTATYTIDIQFSDQTIPSHYEGELIFYMYTDNNSIWRIYFWQDIAREGNIPSWSELKGRFGI